jgi:hypothetical protein
MNSLAFCRGDGHQQQQQGRHIVVGTITKHGWLGLNCAGKEEQRQQQQQQGRYTVLDAIQGYSLPGQLDGRGWMPDAMTHGLAFCTVRHDIM